MMQQVLLNLAIKGELSHQQHVETIAVLVRTYIEQGLYLEALNTLEGASGWQLSQQEAIELVLLRAQAFRAIGLADKAATLLAEKSQYLPSPELRAKVAFELAKCHLENGDLEAARKTLGEAFAAVEPGPLADQIGRELAGVCLRLGQTAQAISVCSQLLERAAALLAGADLVGVATFYHQFRLQPVGRHTLRVCHGTACHVQGAENIHAAVNRALLIPAGHDTTPDNEFTVERVACLGCCTLAPVVAIEHTTYGHLTAGTVGAMLDDFRATRHEKMADVDAVLASTRREAKVTAPKLDVVAGFEGLDLALGKG